MRPMYGEQACVVALSVGLERLSRTKRKYKIKTNWLSTLNMLDYSSDVESFFFKVWSAQHDGLFQVSNRLKLSNHLSFVI